MKKQYKKPLEWYEQLPEPYRQQAIDNLVPGREEFDYGSLGDAINGGFTWSTTPQGQDYWQKLNNLFL